MRQSFVILLTGLLSLAAATAQPARQLFKQGNEHYREGKFDEAIASYEKALDEGVSSAALYYNLGNAYYKTDQLAEAILNYERAQRLDPDDDDIRQNLNIAREQSIDRFEEMPQPVAREAYEAIFKLLSPSGWAYVAIFFLLLMLAGAFLYFFTASNRAGFASGLAALILAVLCLQLAYAHYHYLDDNRAAIVMTASSYVKSGPSSQAEDVFILHLGTKALVTESYGGWKKIKLPDGKVGWIPEEDVEEI